MSEKKKVSDKLRERLKTDRQESQPVTILPTVEETGGNFKITVGELRTVCKESKEPNANVFLKSVEGFKENKVVIVPRFRLQQLLDGGEITEETVMENGNPVTRRTYTPPQPPVSAKPTVK